MAHSYELSGNPAGRVEPLPSVIVHVHILWGTLELDRDYWGTVVAAVLDDAKWVGRIQGGAFWSQL